MVTLDCRFISVNWVTSQQNIPPRTQRINQFLTGPKAPLPFPHTSTLPGCGRAVSQYCVWHIYFAWRVGGSLTGSRSVNGQPLTHGEVLLIACRRGNWAASGGPFSTANFNTVSKCQWAGWGLMSCHWCPVGCHARLKAHLSPPPVTTSITSTAADCLELLHWLTVAGHGPNAPMITFGWEISPMTVKINKTWTAWCHDLTSRRNEAKIGQPCWQHCSQSLCSKCFCSQKQKIVRSAQDHPYLVKSPPYWLYAVHVFWSLV